MKKIITSLLLFCTCIFAQASLYVEAFDEQKNNNKQITLRLRVVNNTENTYNNVQLKYFLPYDASRQLQVTPYYLAEATTNFNVVNNQIEVNINIPTVAPGFFPNEGGMAFGMNYADWQDFDKSASSSYPGTDGYVNATNIAIYIDGVLYNQVTPVVVPTEPATPRFVGLQPQNAKHRAAWVEIANFDAQNNSLKGFTVQDALGNSVELGDGTLEKGKKLNICFTDTYTCPAADISIITTTLSYGISGELTLFNADGKPVDYIAWGEKGPNAASVKAQNADLDVDSYHATYAKDFSLGQRVYNSGDFYRAVISETENKITEWKLFSAKQIEEPITTIPDPDPTSLSDGSIVTIFEGEKMVFSWVSVHNAKAYILTIINKETNEAVFYDKTAYTEIAVDLEPGTYLWTVEASETGDFKTSLETLLLNSDEFTELTLRTKVYSEDHIIYNLNVDPLAARKDTYLMDLQWGNTIKEQNGDKPHNLTAYYDQFHQIQFTDTKEQHYDDEESWRCWIVSAVMLNHYYGGSITQDEIKFRIKGSKTQPALKGFPHGESGGGYTWDSDDALKIALNITDKDLNFTNERPDETLLNNALKEGRPIYIWQRQHIMTIDAMRLDPDVGVFEYRFINTDNNGTYQWRVYEKESNINGAWIPSNVTNAASGDIRIITDSDNDGLYDFDEEERFHTDFLKYDTDDDYIDDKTEILSYTLRQVRSYNRLYGYYYVDFEDYADVDNDGLRAELDPDSDNGGVIDGLEDTNHDGIVDEGETDPFDASDDKNAIVPASMDDFPALYAISKLSFDGNAFCIKADGGYCDLAAAGIQSDNNYPLSIGTLANVGTLYSMGNISLQRGASVHGDINLYGEATIGRPDNQDNRIMGTVNHLQTSEWHNKFVTIFDFMSFTHTEQLIVRANTSETLVNNGQYAFIKVERGATLRIPAGTFWVNNLQIDDGANVEFTQPGSRSTLHVDGDFMWRANRIENANLCERIASSFEVLIHSYNRWYFIDKDFYGRIIAPYSTVVVGQTNGLFYGSIIAFQLNLYYLTNMYHIPFAFAD